ncbi:MAG: hypothetical protein HG466_005645 [Prevotella sp.]|nr:hypothetical protein [Prevotella sp.]
MEKNKAKTARSLLAKLERLEDIKTHIEAEPQHWWSFLTPDMYSKEGLIMPDILRTEFVKAVDRSIE